MLAKTVLLLMLGACVSTAPVSTVDQPALARLVEPYAAQLRAVGITRVISPGSGAMVRLDTAYGAVYAQYPAAAAPSTFELDIGPDALRASAATFDRARDARMLAALVPEAVRLTAANNNFASLRANPWH
jgi:hypothetical protein